MLIFNPLIMSAYSLGLKGNSTIPWFVDSGDLAPCSPNPTVFSYFAAIPNPLGAERKLDQRHVIKRATPPNSSIFLDSYFSMIYLVLNISY